MVDHKPSGRVGTREMLFGKQSDMHAGQNRDSIFSRAVLRPSSRSVAPSLEEREEGRIIGTPFLL